MVQSTLENQIAALATQQQATLGKISARLDELENVRAATDMVNKNLATTTTTLAELSKRLDDVEKKRPQVATPVASANIEAPVHGPDALRNLRTAISRGTAFTSELAAVEKQYPEAGDAAIRLRPYAAGGVMTEEELRTQLVNLLASLETAPPHADNSNFVQNINERFVGFVSIKKQAASDAYARLRSHSGTAELADLKQEVEALKETQRAPFAVWLKSCEARMTTNAALTALSQKAL